MMLRNALALYVHYAKVSIRSQLQYRASVALATLGVCVITASEFVAVWALFDRFGQLRGWTLPEVALFYGMISISWALCDAISRGFDTFGTLVKSGGFDRVLLRPRSTVLQLLAPAPDGWSRAWPCSATRSPRARSTGRSSARCCWSARSRAACARSWVC
jgi:ABC-type uncharacterized transport system permease subunit